MGFKRSFKRFPEVSRGFKNLMVDLGRIERSCKMLERVSLVFKKHQRDLPKVYEKLLGVLEMFQGVSWCLVDFKRLQGRSPEFKRVS